MLEYNFDKVAVMLLCYTERLVSPCASELMNGKCPKLSSNVKGVDQCQQYKYVLANVLAFQ